MLMIHDLDLHPQRVLCPGGAGYIDKSSSILYTTTTGLMIPRLGTFT